MDTPYITIVIPVYNSELYLRECLDSIVNQTFDNYEVLIINDGSTDSSASIIDEYSKRYGFIRVVTQSNKGLFKTRAVGFREARGDYIGWLDSDDFVAPTMLEKMYSAVIKYNSELVICDYSFYPKKTKTKQKWFKQFKGQIDVSFVECNSQPWNKLVSKELAQRIKIADYYETCQDEIYIRAIMNALNPVTLKESLYFYRALGGMSSSYSNIAYFKKFIASSRNLYLLSVKMKDNQYWINYFKNRITYYYLMSMIVAANTKNKKEYNSLKRQLLNEIPFYAKNEHYWYVLREKYGIIKSIIIGKVIPNFFGLSCLICKIVFH